MKNAISYLQNNFSDPFVSLNTAAKAICVSSSYLSRIFHKETGVSFTAYLTELRLHIAKHYLLTTKDSISVIAEKSGYNTAKYFTNLFRKVEGISPNAYRAQSVERAFKPEKAGTERSSCADEKKNQL